MLFDLLVRASRTLAHWPGQLEVLHVQGDVRDVVAVEELETDVACEEEEEEEDGGGGGEGRGGRRGGRGGGGWWW